MFGFVAEFPKLRAKITSKVKLRVQTSSLPQYSHERLVIVVRLMMPLGIQTLTNSIMYKLNSIMYKLLSYVMYLIKHIKCSKLNFHSTFIDDHNNKKKVIQVRSY